MDRIICLIVGYIFGLFQTGYIYSRVHNIDIRSKGSGNSGSTNILRVMGAKAGLVVFLGDFFKTFIPCMAVRIIFKEDPGLMYTLLLYTGFGVILGHNYPFYLKFKGGKGIACTAGILMSMDLIVTLICFIVFVSIVAGTRFVSLGSLAVVTTFMACMVYCVNSGRYMIADANKLEFFIISVAIAIMAYWRHRSNIKRLLSGTENKIGTKK